MRNRGLLAICATAVVALASLAAFGPGRSQPASHAAIAAQISQADVLARTRTLAGNLWPEYQNVLLTPDLTVLRQGIRSPLHQGAAVTAAWQVVCEDASGRPLGTVTWNAVSGRLLSIVAGSTSPPSSSTRFPRMKVSEARKVMRQWTRDLAALENCAAWHETGARSRNKVFVSDWRADGRTARLSIDSCSGELVIYRAAQTSPAGL